jgi:hypothetical protein
MFALVPRILKKARWFVCSNAPVCAHLEANLSPDAIGNDAV